MILDNLSPHQFKQYMESLTQEEQAKEIVKLELMLAF